MNPMTQCADCGHVRIQHPHPEGESAPCDACGCKAFVEPSDSPS